MCADMPGLNAAVFEGLGSNDFCFLHSCLCPALGTWSSSLCLGTAGVDDNFAV